PRQAAHRRLAETGAAQHLGDVLDLPRAHALQVHLHQRQDQRLLAALVPIEELRLEGALAVHRHQQGKRAHARLELPGSVTVPIPAALRGAFKRVGVQVERDLLLQQPLQRRLHDLAQEIGLIHQRLTQARRQSTILQLSHRSTPFLGLFALPILEERWLLSLTRKSQSHPIYRDYGALSGSSLPKTLLAVGFCEVGATLRGGLSRRSFAGLTRF